MLIKDLSKSGSQLANFRLERRNVHTVLGSLGGVKISLLHVLSQIGNGRRPKRHGRCVLCVLCVLCVDPDPDLFSLSSQFEALSCGASIEPGRAMPSTRAISLSVTMLGVAMCAPSFFVISSAPMYFLKPGPLSNPP